MDIHRLRREIAYQWRLYQGSRNAAVVDQAYETWAALVGELYRLTVDRTTRRVLRE